MSAVVLFDGVCIFCSGSVNFIIRHDAKGYFKFTPLQSEIGQEIIKRYGIDPGETDSIVLVEDNKVYTYSTAALRIARRLDTPWSWLYAFVIVPWFIRDVVYKFFAKYRYRLFGKKDVCMTPTPEIRERFL